MGKGTEKRIQMGKKKRYILNSVYVCLCHIIYYTYVLRLL